MWVFLDCGDKRWDPETLPDFTTSRVSSLSILLIYSNLILHFLLLHVWRGPLKRLLNNANFISSLKVKGHLAQTRRLSGESANI